MIMQETGNKIFQQADRRIDGTRHLDGLGAGNGLLVKKTPRLVIRVGRHTLSFSALAPGSASGIVFEPYTVRSGISMAANLREAFREIDLQAGGWQRAMVMVDSPVLMVPIDEYKDSLKDVYYHHSITGRSGESVMHAVLPSLNAVAVYSMNKDLKLVVDDHFTDVRFTHVCTPVWEHLYRRSFTGVRQKLYAYFHDKKLDVFSFQQNRFRFTNSFDTSLVPDAVYFMLNVWKQLAFDNRRDELHLAGELPSRDELVQELRQFIQNVYVINPKAEFNRAPITEIKGLPYDLMTYFLKN